MIAWLTKSKTITTAINKQSRQLLAVEPFPCGKALFACLKGLCYNGKSKFSARWYQGIGGRLCIN